MIARKKKICVECETLQYIFSKGKCQKCSSKGKTLNSGGIIKSKPKQKSPMKTKLDEYFVEKLIQLNKTRKSEESGNVIPYPTRGNICHILDKARHPSVGNHLDNYVFLTWQEHAKFDQYIFNHEFDKLKKEFPNIWPVILKRLETILPACTEKTKLYTAFYSLLNK